MTYNNNPRVFVYGTLRPGGKLNANMANATHIGPAELHGYRMIDTGHGFPAVVKTEGSTDVVYGDLYILNGDLDEEFARLDAIEGVASGLYERKLSQVLYSPAGEMMTRPANVYVAAPGFFPRQTPGWEWIESGDWLRHLTGGLPLAEWQECRGEAHRNPYIDHCMLCMPYWHRVPVCPSDGRKLRGTEGSDRGGRQPGKGYCRTCRKHFSFYRG